MPPLSVCVKVAERQYEAVTTIEAQIFYVQHVAGKSLAFRLAHLLAAIFGDQKLALDHDPALILRKYNPRIKDVAARYSPHAHSVDHLIYRVKANHDEKTFGRKEGAERTVTTKGSDIYLKSKFDRLEGRTKGRPKRAWPQGRKLQSRGFQQRRTT
jgi:hypothetical protein